MSFSFAYLVFITACIGSLGHNCSLPCPNGYYGHGCRYKCDCNDTQTCEPQIGCSAKNNGTCIKNYDFWIIQYIFVFLKRNKNVRCILYNVFKFQIHVILGQRNSLLKTIHVHVAVFVASFLTISSLDQHLVKSIHVSIVIRVLSYCMIHIVVSRVQRLRFS